MSHYSLPRRRIPKGASAKLAIQDANDRRDPEMAQNVVAGHIDDARENILRKLGQI